MPGALSRRTSLSHTSRGYRLHCSVLYRNTSLNLVLAAVSSDSPPDDPLLPGNGLAYVPGPRRCPRKIEINGTYDTAEQKHLPVDFSKEFDSRSLGFETEISNQRKLAPAQKTD